MVLEVCNLKPTHRKSWARNLLMWSDLTLLQGKTTIAKLKSADNLLIICPRVCNMKPTYRRSWAGDILMFSDLTLGHSFNVKQWFTGFGELSFRWIQICIGSLMRRSSLLLYFFLFKGFILFHRKLNSNLFIFSSILNGAYMLLSNARFLGRHEISVLLFSLSKKGFLKLHT